jgi:hypothetical protein
MYLTKNTDIIDILTLKTVIIGIVNKYRYNRLITF